MSERQKEENSREREIGLPFLFLLWAVGRAVWIAMLIGSWKYEEITQNPLDFLTPTWMRPQLSVVSLLFIEALKEVCPSAFRWTDILSLLWSIRAQSRFCSLWVTITIGGFSINYHWNTCGTEEGLFEVGLQIRVLELRGCRDLAWSLSRGQ